MIALPLISVCIGVYNREKYIRETLEDVFAQTYKPLEIIVVDDASTDGTVDILERYGDRIKLIKRSANSGICPVTRNQAWRAATGTYTAFLDSDDGWLPDKIEKQVAFLEEYPDIPLCHTYCLLMDEYSKPCGIRHEGALPPTGPCFKALLRHCIITNSAVMMRNNIHEKVGGRFIEDRRYGIWGEDLEFYLRVARSYDVGLIEEPLTKYRRSESNISSGNWKYIPESVPAHELILRRPDIWRGIVERSEVVGSVVDNARANGRYWAERGYTGRVLWNWSRVLRYRPWSPAVWRWGLLNLLRSVKHAKRV